MAETTTKPEPKPKPEPEPTDRLTSLPDPIITDILSRLPITTAATTSTISHRWRHLWKSITHLTLTTDSPNFMTILNHIIPHLTSPKLHHLTLNLSDPTEFPDGHVINSSFRQLLNTIPIEVITLDVLSSCYEDVFSPPTCLLTSPSLVELELRGKVMFDFFDLTEVEIVDRVNLPRLRRLRIDFLLDVPIWVGVLVRACLALEELDLTAKLDIVESEVVDRVDFICPSLRRLKIDLEWVSETLKRTLVSVYAPELETIMVENCTSCYCFIEDPSRLVDACVDMRRNGDFVVEESDTGRHDDDGGGDDDHYVCRMGKFVLGMSSVSRLELKVGNHANVFNYLGCVSDNLMCVFGNLIRFDATLDCVGLIGWESLLLSMQRFPNLKYLKVDMEGHPLAENNVWCPPHVVPDCLASKLRTIYIWGLRGVDDELKLAAFVLNNARILEEFRVDVFIQEESDKKRALWKECLFCESLFKLPRISSTCEVLFSGRVITTSSTTFNIDHFKGQMFLDA